MDTPTRERIEQLEQRVKELEGEVAELRSKLGAVTSGPDLDEINKKLYIDRSRFRSYYRSWT